MLMSNVTTLAIGGPAKDFQVVKSEEELLDLVKKNPDFLLIGGGSNLLVSDEGIDRLVIQNAISGIKQKGGILKVKSGTILQDLVNFSISRGLAGLQKLTGIPGTVGGAVFGNAGAYGQTISDNLIKVVILSERSPSGLSLRVEDESKDLSHSECHFNYRDSIFKKTHDIILEITFKLAPGDPKTLAQEAKEVLEKRLVKYPIGIKCPGSFFKNIVADTVPKEILKKIPQEKIVYGKIPAGYLLEEVGAKGQKLDDIEIASYHANLFVNQGGGKASDFYALAQKYALAVKEKYGIILAPEVQLINLPPI